MFLDKPNKTLVQLLKKNVGPNKYNSIIKKIDRHGNRSKKKLKNKNSATKKIEPGKPKKIKQFSKETRKSLGHKKFIPLISVNNLVLKRRLIASTSKNELVERSA